MLLRFYVEIDFAHDAVWIDQKRVARGDLGDAEIHHRVIECGNFLLGVREQLEVQPFLGAELLVGIFVLHADANDYGVLLLVLRQVALEVVGFHRAPARKILRVEIEHHPLALEIVQANRLGLLRIQREVRCGTSDGWCLAIRVQSADSQAQCR